MKKLAWYTAVGLATLMAAFLVWEFRTAIILFILSLTVAAILRPMVEFLVFHRLPRGLALVITYLGVVAVLAVLGSFLVGPVISELQALAGDLPIRYQQLQTQWLGGSIFQRTLAQNFLDLNILFQTITGGQWTVFFQNFMGITLGSLGLISDLLIILVLSVYWSADQDRLKRLWLSLLPSESRARWREVWKNIEAEIGSYLRSEIIQSLLTVIFLAIGYQLIGLNYPVLLAVFGAISWLIAWFGGLAAVLLSVLAGLSISPGIGFLAGFFTLVVLVFLEFIVEPRFFIRQRLSSLLAVILVLIMIKQYGMIGFLAAPPLAAAVQIIVTQLVRPKALITLPPPPSVQIDFLRERLNSVQNLVSERPEPPSPEINNLIDRLDKLIERANSEEQFTD